MTNTEIAIDWARQQCSAGKLVISPQFFQPFRSSERKAIARTLSREGIVVVQNEDKVGAVLIPHNITNLAFTMRGRTVAGVHRNGDNITTFAGSVFAGADGIAAKLAAQTPSTEELFADHT